MEEGRTGQSSDVVQSSDRRRLSDGALVQQEQNMLADMQLDEGAAGTAQIRSRERTPRNSRLSLQSRPDTYNSMDRMPGRDLLDIVHDQGRRFDGQIHELVQRQKAMETTAGTLVQSLTVALNKLGESQIRQDTMIQLHADALNQVTEQHRIAADQNRRSEVIAQQQQDALSKQQQENALVVEQVKQLFQEQSQRIGSQENYTQEIKTRLQAMTAENRKRTPLTVKTEPFDEPMLHFGPKEEKGKKEVSESSTERTKTEMNANKSAWNTNAPVFNHPPSMMGFGITIPNAMIENCPPFAPQGYQQWRREMRLWKSAQAGATTTQLMAKIITVLPLSIKMDALSYMEETEACPESRDLQKLFDLLDERYGRTDTEKAWMWLSQFNDFKRNVSAHENFKEFWARYQRTITKLKSLGMDMSEDMTFHKAIQALKLPDGQLPIVLAALKTSGEATSLKALRELTIKMYETHKSSGDATEVYHAQPESTPTIIPEVEEELEEESEWEITDESGQTFLMRPKKRRRVEMLQELLKPHEGAQ